MKYFYRLILSMFMFTITSTYVVSSQDRQIYSWGVVYSSDITVKEAKPEIIQLPRLFPQYQNQNRLFKYKNFYASVVLFPTKKEADDASKKIGQKYSREVFVVNIPNWCRRDWINSKYTKKGIIDCNKVEIASNKNGVIIINDPIRDIAKANDALITVKDKLDKLINTGQNSAFIDIEQDVTIFKKGNSFYIALINYADLSLAEKAVRSVPYDKSDKFYNNFTPFDLKEWCNPKSNVPNNVPNKAGFIECNKRN